MRTLSAGIWKMFNPARLRSSSRSLRVVRAMGSTTLMRNGSMGTLASGMLPPFLQNDTSLRNSR
jgi:hypothetical protein